MTAMPPHGAAQTPEPVWEIATLYPPQGGWTDEGYLSLTDTTNRLIEFTDGRIEFLPMPTKAHQLILMFLLEALRGFVQPTGLGLALPAPLRVKIRDGKFREPDIVFVGASNSGKAGNEFYDSADWVMEVVGSSPEGRRRDLLEKLVDYSEAGIAEYWIVDPVHEKITICTAPDAAPVYTRTREFVRGDMATSELLAGFAVQVAQVFDAA